MKGAIDSMTTYTYSQIIIMEVFSRLKSNIPILTSLKQSSKVPKASFDQLMLLLDGCIRYVIKKP